MPSKIRLQRISERFREQLSEILLYKIQDPRVSGVSVTDVEIDRELAFADIFVSALEGQQRAAEVLDVLNHASGFIRHLLAERIDLRTFPVIRFHWDTTPERVDHLDAIFNQIRKENDKG
jgi:ribosome-binding factor A